MTNKPFTQILIDSFIRDVTMTAPMPKSMARKRLDQILREKNKEITANTIYDSELQAYEAGAKRYRTAHLRLVSGKPTQSDIKFVKIIMSENKRNKKYRRDKQMKLIYRTFKK